MSKRKIKFRIVDLVCVVASTFIAAILMIPVDVHIKPVKTEWSEVTALRTLSSALKINFLSIRFRIHYDSGKGNDTVMEYNRLSRVLLPYGKWLGPRPADECHDQFYFTQITAKKIHKAAAKHANFKNLSWKDDWNIHEYNPLCE